MVFVHSVFKEALTWSPLHAKLHPYLTSRQSLLPRMHTYYLLAVCCRGCRLSYQLLSSADHICPIAHRHSFPLQMCFLSASDSFIPLMCAPSTSLSQLVCSFSSLYQCQRDHQPLPTPVFGLQEDSSCCCSMQTSTTELYY